MARARSRQNMCPICNKQFAEGEMVIEYRKWSGEAGGDIYLGHLDCVLQLSMVEKRSHPPLTAVRALSSEGA